MVDVDARRLLGVIAVPGRTRWAIYDRGLDRFFVNMTPRPAACSGRLPLSGAPDVIFLDPALGRLYVAVGDPGVIDVIDVRAMRRLETVPTEPGAHTTALDGRRHRLYVFLPKTHRAAVFVDG